MKENLFRLSQYNSEMRDEGLEQTDDIEEEAFSVEVLIDKAIDKFDEKMKLIEMTENKWNGPDSNDILMDAVNTIGNILDEAQWNGITRENNDARMQYKYFEYLILQKLDKKFGIHYVREDVLSGIYNLENRFFA